MFIQRTAEPILPCTCGKHNVSKDADIGKALRAGSFACYLDVQRRWPGSASMGVAGGEAQWECRAEPARRFRSARYLRSPRASPTVPKLSSAWRTSSSRVRPWRSFRTRPSPETLPNWPGACGKTQIAVMIAESLWRSRVIDGLVWISATSRAAVLSGFVQASVAATGLEPAGTANSVAVRFVSWLGETRQPWLVVLDDVPESRRPEPDCGQPGRPGRLLITSPRPAPVLGRPGTRVIPVGFFSTREALNGLSERLSANPDQRQGAINLVETLGCEPLALGQASAVVESSNLTCRDYRDLFVQRRDEIWTGSDEHPVGGHGDLDPVPGAGGIAAAQPRGPAHAGLPGPAGWSRRAWSQSSARAPCSSTWAGRPPRLPPPPTRGTPGTCCWCWSERA